MDLPFSKKTALVVGSSSGIGLSVAKRLRALGAQVRGIGRHAIPDPQVTVLDLDIAENRSRVLEMAGKCDILVVVRGPFEQKPLEDTSPATWDFLVTANLVFPGQLVSAALPRMCLNEWGRILLFGGTRTDRIRGFRTNAAYAAAKTGISSLVLSTAQEYASRGITCNAICPGFVTPGEQESEKRVQFEERNPGVLYVGEEDIANTAEFLLKNSSINGAIVRADRGWTPSFI